MCTLINILSPSNYNQFNITLAHKIGLETAIYLNELFNIYEKASRKEKIKSSKALEEYSPDEDYFIVDRDYITQRTTFSRPKQLELDANLLGLQLIKKPSSNPDELCIDQIQYINFFTSPNEKIFRKLKPITKYRTEKEQRREYNIESTKLLFKSEDTELYALWSDWVDTVMTNDATKGRVNAISAREFKNGLERFANGHRDALIELIKLSIELSYTVSDWVIVKYKERHPEISKTLKKLPTINGTKTTNSSNPILDLEDIF